ncbi:hypothetical protein HX37_00005 [Salmonella enterica]|uniref:Uncharacterized protein n=1 Tax=Salmonella enterica TaxID=28901 RepID=A0A5U2EWA1_SALER|nr:hypothetical protein [Citrobacter koseri]EBP0009264.1 hypothetical protein [Salmonella enterica]EHZ9859101.1 hypothetical protein [Salmonella enterica]EJT3365993.1 hypothetical protein [Salmonella enterica]WOI97959.1 hypothetical protein R1158_18955 [Citrobacter koseri]
MSDPLDLARPHLANMSEEEKLKADVLRHKTKHVLYPPFFQLINELPDLEWRKVKFTADSRRHIPKEKGVYAFAIDLGTSKLPGTSYILYVGKAGDINSDNTLFNRFYDYIRTQRRNNRPRIHDMLTLWKDHLSYYYAVVADGQSTGELEEKLLNILIPPYNKGDFSAEMSSLLRGVNII